MKFNDSHHFFGMLILVNFYVHVYVFPVPVHVHDYPVRIQVLFYVHVHLFTDAAKKKILTPAN
jgi:hypothetical protein